RIGSFSAQSAAIGFDDRLGHRNPEDGTRSEAYLRPDARPEAGDFDGSLLVGGRPVQYLCGSAGRRQDCAGGCLCYWLSAPPGKSFLRAAETAGQDRHHDAGQEADRSSLAGRHGRELQAPGDDRADAAAEIAVSSWSLVVSRTSC